MRHPQIQVFGPTSCGSLNRSKATWGRFEGFGHRGPEPNRSCPCWLCGHPDGQKSDGAAFVQVEHNKNPALTLRHPPPASHRRAVPPAIGLATAPSLPCARTSRQRPLAVGIPGSLVQRNAHGIGMPACQRGGAEIRQSHRRCRAGCPSWVCVAASANVRTACPKDSCP